MEDSESDTTIEALALSRLSRSNNKEEEKN